MKIDQKLQKLLEKFEASIAKTAEARTRVLTIGGGVEKYRKAYELRGELATWIALHVLELAKKDALKSILKSVKRSQGNKDNPESQKPTRSLEDEAALDRKVKWVLGLLSTTLDGKIRDPILARKLEFELRNRVPKTSFSKSETARLEDIKARLHKTIRSSLERDTLVEKMVELGGP